MVDYVSLVLGLKILTHSDGVRTHHLHHVMVVTAFQSLTHCTAARFSLFRLDSRPKFTIWT
jgi:hypothetical protein